jgi:hypothetical protein
VQCVRCNSLAASTQHAGAAAAAVLPKAGCVFELHSHGRRVLLHGGNLAAAQAATAPRKLSMRNNGSSKAKRAAQPNQQRAVGLSWEL